MAQGTVKWFHGEWCFGFIDQDGGGAHVFVHYSEIDSTDYWLFVPERGAPL